MSNSNAKSGGIGFCSALFLIFLTLRLTDHIDWAWYWVAAPLWMPIGLVLGVVAVVCACIGVAALLDWNTRRRRFNRAGKAAAERLRRMP